MCYLSFHLFSLWLYGFQEHIHFVHSTSYFWIPRYTTRTHWLQRPLKGNTMEKVSDQCISQRKRDSRTLLDYTHRRSPSFAAAGDSHEIQCLVKRAFSAPWIESIWNNQGFLKTECRFPNIFCKFRQSGPPFLSTLFFFFCHFLNIFGKEEIPMPFLILNTRIDLSHLMTTRFFPLELYVSYTKINFNFSIGGTILNFKKE